MNILVSNDDGIKAEGIQKLVEALSEVGDVYVVAPDSQRSAASHGLSLRQDIYAKKTIMPFAKEAFAVSGTPVDCVKLGLHIFKKKGIEMDIVFAGINHGGNLGTDAVYSGTVSAAAEGAFYNLPAVAVSVNSHNPQYFEGACRAAVNLLPYALKLKNSHCVLDVNLPDLPEAKIKGLRAAKLGQVIYDEWLNEIEVAENGESILYRYSGEPRAVETTEDDVDTKLMEQGYGTVVVVHYDLNHYEEIEKMKGWEIPW